MPRKFGATLEWTVLLVWLLLIVFPWSYFFDGSMNLLATNEGPSVAHPFGTDGLGRDLLINVAAALHQSVLPLWGVVTLACIAGYLCSFLIVAYNERLKALALANVSMQALAGIFLSVPIGIFVFLLANLMERAGLRSIMIALALFSFFRAMLLIHDLYSQDRHLEYWQAHKSMGGSLAARLWNYGFARKWQAELISNLAFSLSIAISIEAALSYLGFGVQPPNLSVGNLLSANYKELLQGHFASLVVPLGMLLLCFLVPVAVMRILTRHLRPTVY